LSFPRKRESNFFLGTVSNIDARFRGHDNSWETTPYRP